MEEKVKYYEFKLPGDQAQGEISLKDSIKKVVERKLVICKNKLPG